MSKYGTVLLTLIISMLMMAPLSSYEADGASGIWVDLDDSAIDIGNRDSKSIMLSIYNMESEPCRILVETSSNYKGASASSSVDEYTLMPTGDDGDEVFVNITISTTKMVENGTGSFSVKVSTFYPGGLSFEPYTKTIQLNISSEYASDGHFNKIMGSIISPLPGELNTPIINMLITLAIWCALAFIIAFLSVRITRKLLIGSKDLDEAEKKNSETLGKMEKFVFMFVILFGISNCLKVLGADEYVIATVSDISEMLFIVFGAMILWSIVRTEIVAVTIKMEKKDEIDTSLAPLLLMIVKIMIFTAATFYLLAVFGINLASIIASMGLIATAISLGAKSIIGQFFSGLVLLIERSVVEGDKIRIEGDNSVLIVEDVGVMNTKFKSWSNEEKYMIPNNVLTDRSMVNITRDNPEYKVYDYYDIEQSADIDRAKEIIYECVYDHPDVVVEGAIGKPDVRFFEVTRSSVKLKVAFAVNDHENYGSIAGAIRRNVFLKFNEEGIGIPFDQYTVNLIKSSDE